MSLALATKGILPDFTGTGTGTGPGETVYVLEEFNVEVAHEDVDILVNQMDDVAINISEVRVSIDLDGDQAEIVVSEDETINIEV